MRKMQPSATKAADRETASTRRRKSGETTMKVTLPAMAAREDAVSIPRLDGQVQPLEQHRVGQVPEQGIGRDQDQQPGAGEQPERESQRAGQGQEQRRPGAEPSAKCMRQGSFQGAGHLEYGEQNSPNQPTPMPNFW